MSNLIPDVQQLRQSVGRHRIARHVIKELELVVKDLFSLLVSVFHAAHYPCGNKPR